MLKTVNIFLLICSFYNHSLGQNKIPTFSEFKKEEVQLGKLNRINLITETRLDSTQFVLDTLYIEMGSNSIFSILTNQNTLIKKLDNKTYYWECSGLIVLKAFGLDLASEIISMNGLYELEIDSKYEIELSNSINEINFDSTFEKIQYFWLCHLILTIISGLILIISNSHLTLRHIALVFIPNLGPIIFLIGKVWRLTRSENALS